jgi:hypothetical protein
VQPCDEDEEKDDYFFPLFQVMEHRRNEIDREKTGVLGGGGGEPVPVSLCPPQSPHGATRDRTRASAVGGRATNLLSHGTAVPEALSLFCACCITHTRHVEKALKYVNTFGILTRMVILGFKV